MDKLELSEKVSGLFWIMRPLNSTTAAFAVVVALHLAAGQNPLNFNLFVYLFVALAAFFVTAHAMTHNDIVDFEIDKINSPNRPITSGRISIREAKFWAIILFLLAGFSGVMIDLLLDQSFPFSLFWAILNIVILDVYNIYLKKSGIFGNLVIGYVVLALFLYADIVINQQLTLRTESIGLYAFFLIWGREVYKGIIDIEGDRLHNVKTIPVILGPKGGAIVGSIIILIGVAWSIPLIISPLGSIIIPIVLTLLDIVIIFWCIRIIQNPSQERAFQTKLWLLRILFLALIVLAINQFSTSYL